MDPSLPRIIKQPEAHRVTSVALDGTPLAASGRIPRELVRTEAAGAPTPRPRVIPRGRSVETVNPWVLEDPLSRPSPGATPPAGEPTAEREAEPLQAPSRDFDAELVQAEAAGFERGFEAGRAEAEALAAAEREADARAFAADLAQVEEAWQAYLGALEPKIAQIAFRVAELVLSAPLPEAVYQASQRAMTDAVERLSADAPVELSLHPVDYLRLQEARIDEQLRSAHRGLRFHPDPDLKHGEWVVSSPTATVRRLERELLDSLRDSLGLHPHDAA